MFKIFKRYLNSSQTATALRPFYFAVHPDLFGRYPKERSVNEESLKVLHEYVASLQTNRTLQPIDLKFYIRNPKNVKDFRNINVSLKSRDLRTTVSTILESCGLSLDYLDTVPKPERTHYNINWIKADSWSGGPYNAEVKYSPPPPRTLRHWLEKNEERVRSYAKASQEAQVEIDALCERIVTRVGVNSVRWENIWGNRHYIACLRSFNQLSDNQLGRMRNTLKGRTLVFSNLTGVNLHGEVVLGSEDVTTEWMSLLQSVHAHDPTIERLPRMERELSLSLHHIQIMRREKREFVMAQMYEVLLNKMLNSLRKCQDQVARQLGDQDLSHLEMVVECESGPLALSNGGQFLIPASIPGGHMIKFIMENKDQAATFLIDAKYHTFYMTQILEQCTEHLNVSQITRDDAVTPQQMTECGQRLLDIKFELNPLLQGTKLKVSTYYTVMRDGEITIPWNWLD